MNVEMPSTYYYPTYYLAMTPAAFCNWREAH